METVTKVAETALWQVFVCYGERLSNVQLLLNFGFVIPDNFVSLPLARIASLFIHEPSRNRERKETSKRHFPSLAHLASMRYGHLLKPLLQLYRTDNSDCTSATLSLELEDGDRPNASGDLKCLRLLAASWRSCSSTSRVRAIYLIRSGLPLMELLQLRISTESEFRFLKELVLLLLENRHQPDRTRVKVGDGTHLLSSFVSGNPQV